MSISNDDAPDIGERILEAAGRLIVALGAGRVTVAEIARRAGVSRPTVYRRWPDTQSIIAAVLTARILTAVDRVPGGGTGRQDLVERIVAVTDQLRHDDVIMEVLHFAPNVAMVYITERLGTSQQMVIDVLAAGVAAAQAEGSVRAGDPRQLAAMILLITQSTVQSAQIVAPILDSDALAAELTHSLNGYLS
jgi:AcrR family transcriptional regulator